MLKLADLKDWLHRDLERVDKLLLILAALDAAASVSQIKDAAASAGFREPKKWNISRYLSRSKGKAIRTDAGWELTDVGKLHLRRLGGELYR